MDKEPRIEPWRQITIKPRPVPIREFRTLFDAGELELIRTTGPTYSVYRAKSGEVFVHFDFRIVGCRDKCSGYSSQEDYYLSEKQREKYFSEASSGGTHVLDGIFDTDETLPDILPSELNFLKDYLNLEEIPALTVDRMKQLDKLLPRTQMDYTFSLVRAVCCYLSEVVRIKVDGTYEIEIEPGLPRVWVPKILAPGYGSVVPAMRYASAFERKPPTLYRCYQTSMYEMGFPFTN
jgi:hypothetical protein